ncbi:MAG: GNAT family N-acetyltransferase [Pedosphaera sp.]|nr:GNAT family N-acetyltransferase [Pedosphaera sp.]
MKKDSVVLRMATDEDIPLIRSLAEQIWRACYSGMISEGQIVYMLDWMYSAARLGDDCRGGGRYEIVSQQGVTIGYLATVRAESSAVLQLNKLYLLPEKQGCGLGQLLLAHTETLARQQGCEVIELRVNKENARALRAYYRAGFTWAESVVVDIGGGYVMDDFILRKKVK